MPLLGLTIRRALLSYNYWLRSGKRESWGVRAVGPWHNPALAISPLNNQFTPMVCVSPHCYTNRHTLRRTTYTCNTATYTVVPISTVLTSCCTVDTLYSNIVFLWGNNYCRTTISGFRNFGFANFLRMILPLYVSSEVIEYQNLRDDLRFIFNLKEGWSATFAWKMIQCRFPLRR